MDAIIPTNDDLMVGMKDYQQLAACDLLNTVNPRQPEWLGKKFLSDLQDLYKSVQYQIFNIYDNKSNLTDTKMFRSGLELYDYITQTINKGKPFDCKVYYDYNKKNIALLNNGKVIMLIPSITESKKRLALEKVITELVEKKLKEYITMDDKKNMKPWYKIADKIAKQVQDKIKKKGAYKNAGQKEITDFKDKLEKTKLSYHAKSELSDYINKLIDNLQY